MKEILSSFECRQILKETIENWITVRNKIDEDEKKRDQEGQSRKSKTKRKENSSTLKGKDRKGYR